MYPYDKYGLYSEIQPSLPTPSSRLLSASDGVASLVGVVGPDAAIGGIESSLAASPSDTSLAGRFSDASLADAEDEGL